MEENTQGVTGSLNRFSGGAGAVDIKCIDRRSHHLRARKISNY